MTIIHGLIIAENTSRGPRGKIVARRREHTVFPLAMASHVIHLFQPGADSPTLIHETSTNRGRARDGILHRPSHGGGVKLGPHIGSGPPKKIFIFPLALIPDLGIVSVASNKADITKSNIMKTRSYHISNLGSYAPSHIADSNGYVTYHESDRYGKATGEQLEGWAESRTKAVRNAAITEQAERELAKWQKGN